MFYGWWIVGACFLLSFYASGTIFFGLTTLFEPIAREFGWSYAQISVAASIRGLESGFLAPVLGLMFDRWGPRKLVFSGAIIIGSSLLLLSTVQSLGMFYLVFILLSAGAGTCGGMVPMATVGGWFRKKVAVATGIVVSGVSPGGLLVPLITIAIDTYGWRTAMAIFGVATFIICVPLSLVLRHKPEQYGYLPDGDTAPAPTAEKKELTMVVAEVNIPTRQALKSRAFWHVSLAFMLHFLVINSVITHVMPYLGSIGIGRTTASLVASGAPLVSILGRLSFGWFGDRFDKRRVAATGLAVTGFGMVFFGLGSAGEMWLIVMFLVLFGIGWGGIVPMTAAMAREYFGRQRLGTMLGLIMGIMMIGNIAGPPIAGWAFDVQGSYKTVWFVYAAVVMVSVIIMLTTPAAGRTKHPAGVTG